MVQKDHISYSDVRNYKDKDSSPKNQMSIKCQQTSKTFGSYIDEQTLNRAISKDNKNNIIGEHNYSGFIAL